MKKKIIAINKKLIKQFGTPQRPKILPKPIDMLIGTILSQNTNDRNSYQAYKNLKEKYSNWDEVNKAKRTLIEKEIKVAGLGFQKSTAIKNLLKELEKQIGNFELKEINSLDNENSIKYLTSFKGVGVKTASCVLLFSLDKNVCPVDTHLHRTLNRIGIVKTSAPDKTYFEINKDFPPKIAHSFHTNLIRLGREICTPKNYKCNICPLVDICNFDSKNFTEITKTSERSFMLLDNI
ncbi:MAG: endonuclease III [Ignavibacteriales bacterium]|nr:endonuclease III [Ignavibacteriales bacterium]